MNETPRERFVKAMREWIKRGEDVGMMAFVHGMRLEPTTCAMDAVRAFADAVCEVEAANRVEGRCWPDRHEAALGWTREKMHESCRATLEREVFDA